VYYYLSYDDALGEPDALSLHPNPYCASDRACPWLRCRFGPSFSLLFPPSLRNDYRENAVSFSSLSRKKWVL